MADDIAERWLPADGYEGLYEVSDQGRVRSVPHWTRSGVRGGTVLKLFMGTSGFRKGYLHARMYREAVATVHPVHRLVARAFHGPRPEGLDTRHLDDDKLNNWASNLTYGTRSENKQDAVRNGINPNSLKTHCPRNHEYTPGNTYYAPSRPHVRRSRACIPRWGRQAQKVKPGSPQEAAA